MKIFAHLLFSHEAEAEGVRNGRRRLDIRRGNIADGPTKRIINATNVIRKCYPSQACICSLPRCISDSLPRPASDIHLEICRLALLKLTWDFSQSVEIKRKKKNKKMMNLKKQKQKSHINIITVFRKLYFSQVCMHFHAPHTSQALLFCHAAQTVHTLVADGKSSDEKAKKKNQNLETMATICCK